ncbi:MAG TPA: FMN-binding protein [Clostridia bacterium]|nr:FMN-binding protein [Clostridia bacterium]HRX42526.1 FMN-binding protein [Clostridia bacterium]
MEVYINLIFAWISVFTALILIMALFTRKSIVAFPGQRKFFITLNKALRKHHKLIGIVLLAVALIHGLFSTESVFSLNLGTISWLIAVLLGINWLLRKKLIKIKGWMFYHRVLVAVFAVSIVIHVIDVGGIQIFNILKPTDKSLSEVSEITVTEPVDETNPSSGKRHRGGRVSAAETDKSNSLIPVSDDDFKTDGIYNDGTYTGEATGFRPGLVVSVEIKDGMIASVEVIDHNEVSSRFYQRPIDLIPDRIVAEQSTDVDAISGATCTSDGIMEAVEDALSKASSTD